MFFWGLGYKLSLYQAQAANVHRIPEAKLLSHNEDRNATEGVRLCLVKAESPIEANPFLGFLLLWLTCAAGVFAHWDREYFSTPKPWRVQSGPIQNTFFLRPPPGRCRL